MIGNGICSPFCSTDSWGRDACLSQQVVGRTALQLSSSCCTLKGSVLDSDTSCSCLQTLVAGVRWCTFVCLQSLLALSASRPLRLPESPRRIACDERFVARRRGLRRLQHVFRVFGARKPQVHRSGLDSRPEESARNIRAPRTYTVACRGVS